MGLSTIIEINNDFLDVIEENPEKFAKELLEKIQSYHSGVHDLPYGRFYGICHRDSKIYKDFRKLFEF